MNFRNIRSIKHGKQYLYDVYIHIGGEDSEMILINVPNFMQPSSTYIFIYDKSIWFLFGITTQGLKDHFIHLINYLPQSHKL